MRSLAVMPASKWHRAAVFALQRLVRHQAHLHMAAAHFDNLRLPLAVGSSAVEQGDGIAGLQAQHLHMAGGTRGQVELGTSGQRQGAMKAGHIKQGAFTAWTNHFNDVYIVKCFIYKRK